MLAWVIALAASLFVQNWRKAESRAEPAERIEYYNRAIRAWGPAESGSLLGQCHFGRGQAFLELWRFAEAEPDLSRTLELDPNNSKAYLLRGKARARLSKLNEAAQDLIEYLARTPADQDGLMSLAEVHLKTGRANAAMKTCKTAQQAETSDGRAWLCEGRAWMARKQWSAAERALNAADEKSNHRLADALAERAVCRVAQGRHAQALKDYTAALGLLEARLQELSRQETPQAARADQQQTTARVFYGRGRVHEFLLQASEAQADYQQACRLGHDQACARAPLPKSVKPRRRAPNPDNNAGERIYGG